MLHALPMDADLLLSERLLEIAHRIAADALSRCHRALELDVADDGYTLEERLPSVYDITGPVIRSRA